MTIFSNNATQTTAVARPTYIATGGINNYPAVRFDGLSGNMNLPNGTLGTGNNPLSIVAVVTPNQKHTSG